MSKERRYTIEPLPSSESAAAFAIPYTPESFTPEEIRFLKPFFTNVDRPVYIIQHLPEEVIGALSSRYSRTTESLRRVFLREYVEPVVYPERQKDWNEKTGEQKDDAELTKQRFLETIEFLNSPGGIDYVVNIQRGRRFFDRWLAEYGDDSIAELGGVHLCIEGLSNIATKEIEDKRIGISPLEKSSRYVSFTDKKPDGNFQYIIPGEIRETDVEDEYKEAMNYLFQVYSELSEPYLGYIKELYPRGEDESESSFINSRRAKRFDDLRDLLPFSTQTNVALFGNGRAFEDLVNRLMYHPIGELRYWGQEICSELEIAVPSFVRRPKTARGAEMQLYRSNISLLKDELNQEVLPKESSQEFSRWVRLVSSTPEADIKIISAFLFGGSQTASFSQVEESVRGMTKTQRAELLSRILSERKLGKTEAQRPEVRFRKVPRAFENARYFFEVWARGGDYRDLHRHRQQTQERQKFTTRWGYDLESEVIDSPFAGKISAALENADEIYQKMFKLSPDIAQYSVPFAYLQHWYMNLTAREIYWICELRTGPQGRPHYREIAQQIASGAKARDPSVFQSIMVDRNDYRLSRRESEKNIERRINSLG